MTDESDQELLLLVDPVWTATAERPEPGIGEIVGGWLVAPDGSSGRFEPNPDYVPSRPGSPTDPVDAVLQLLARGESDGAALMSVLRDVDLGVALHEDGTAVVQAAPDGPPSVLVATSPPHRSRVAAAGWREVTVAQLAAALPAEGVDVLLNPGAPASMRVLADAVREAGQAG